MKFRKKAKKPFAEYKTTKNLCALLEIKFARRLQFFAAVSSKQLYSVLRRIR